MGAMKRKKIKIHWTCSDNTHHSHRFKFTANICGKIQHLKEKIKNIENENIVFMNTIFLQKGDFLRRNETPKFKISRWLLTTLLAPFLLVAFHLIFIKLSINKGFNYSFKRIAQMLICLYLGVSDRIIIEKVK
jgi:hypothetical protein